MYQREWTTSLFHFDPESCILAYVLPCHIYAKIQGSYLCSFLYYGIFSVSIYNVYYWLNFINKNRCPESIADQCFGLKENCSQYYMIINGIPSKCIFNELCYHSESSCFTNFNKLNMYLSLFGSFCYFILFSLNYLLREKVKTQYNIEGKYDSCAVTIFSCCGLAQEYREIESVRDVYLNV